MLKKIIFGLAFIALSAILLKMYYSAPQLQLEEVELMNLDDEPISLNTFTDKPIVVNYWATWCPPCRAEFPAFEKVKQAYSDSIHFVMISDESVQLIKEFANRYSYSFTFLRSALPLEHYGVHSRPNTLIYNTEGELIHAITGELSYDELYNLLAQIK